MRSLSLSRPDVRFHNHVTLMGRVSRSPKVAGPEGKQVTFFDLVTKRYYESKAKHCLHFVLPKQEFCPNKAGYTAQDAPRTRTSHLRKLLGTDAHTLL